MPIAIRRRGRSEGRGDARRRGGSRLDAAPSARGLHVGEGAGARASLEAAARERDIASISELAQAEKIDRGYLGRILQLTLLAPDIVEAILDGRQPPDMGLPRLMKPFPLIWGEQRLAMTSPD